MTALWSATCDSLPDTYTLADYQGEVAGHHVRGIVWSDAAAEDPIMAAGWVQRQCDELATPAALVTLSDPADDGFADLIERFRTLTLARGVRVRLVPALTRRAGPQSLLEDDRAMANLEIPPRASMRSGRSSATGPLTASGRGYAPRSTPSDRSAA